VRSRRNALINPSSPDPIEVPPVFAIMVSFLVARFVDPRSGTVCIDCHDVRDVTLEALGGHLGMVFQGHLPLPREPCRQPALRAPRRERRRRW